MSIVQTLLGSKIAAAVSGVSWDPAFKDPSVTISNMNLTASATGVAATGSTRANLGRSSGKFYFEVLKNRTGAALNPSIGVQTSSEVRTGNQVGDGPATWGLLQDGRAYHNGSTIGPIIGGFGDGDTCCVAVDLDAGLLWFGRNGSFSGSPSAGTGAAYSGVSGLVYPAATPGGGGSVTARFGSADCAYSPPSGFAYWE